MSREALSADAAIEMLADGDHVHTFCNSAAGMLIGADWRRDEIIAAIRASAPERAGPVASGMGHGIFIPHNGMRLFIATKEPQEVET